MRRLVTVTAVPLALAAAAYVASQSGGPRAVVVDPHDPVSVIEAGDVVYRYNAISGQESLFNRGADPHLRNDVSSERRPDVLHLRRRLLARERVESLEQIRARHAEVIASLRALGYM